MIVTPCIGVCSTAVGDEVCFGCARTFGEISNWLAMTDGQRGDIMVQLSRRKVWVQMAMQTGGRLSAISCVSACAQLDLTPDLGVDLGLPLLLEGKGYVLLQTKGGRQCLLPVHRDDWLDLFWDFLFDVTSTPAS